MGTLVDWKIRELALNNRAISPFSEDQLNPASYNLRIGPKGMVETP